MTTGVPTHLRPQLGPHLTARRAARSSLAALLALGACLAALAAAARLEAGTGYGYKKSEEPLVLGIKRIIYDARRNDWKAAGEEFARLGWQFEEFKKDLEVDIAGSFQAAVEARSIPELSREVARVMYFALVQKFHWNLEEKCAKFVPAKSRTEAAEFYYEQILSIGVRDSDKERDEDARVHAKIVAEFTALRQTIGSAGLFGIGARKPDPERFAKGSEAILAHLRAVYPHVAPEPEKEGDDDPAPAEK